MYYVCMCFTVTKPLDSFLAAIDDTEITENQQINQQLLTLSLSCFKYF